jgi:hypothetical protein
MQEKFLTLEVLKTISQQNGIVQDMAAQSLEFTPDAAAPD